jgi:predicted Zn-dependent peptidase
MLDPYAKFQSATLPNGLTVYAAHWPEQPWEAMGFLVHSGAEHDPIGLEGLSHFVEHLVSINTDTQKSDTHAFFDECGGMVNLGITGYPYTKYRFFVPTDKIVKALSIFGQMLLLAKLEKFIEKERQIIIGEFNQNYPIKFRLELEMREHKALYADHWLERFVRPLGNPESIGRITQNDLQSYYDTHYTPANISVVGVGGMKLSELVESLSKSPFATNKKGMRMPIPSPVTDFSLLRENHHVLEMSKHFTITIPIEAGAYWSVTKIPGNVNACAVNIMSEMLDEIVNEEVRERRAWTYAIDSSYHSFRSFFEFSINCNTFALEALDEIEEVIETCITSIGDREDLFNQAKRYALARNFIIDKNGKNICDDVLSDLAHHQRIISLAEYANDIERVKMTDVCDLMKWLRPERRWTLITKP